MPPPEGLWPPPGPRSVVVVVHGGLAGPAAQQALCDRIRMALCCTGADVVTCDVSRLAPVTLAAVDALARAQLKTRQAGRRLRLRAATAELDALLALVGLRDVLGDARGEVSALREASAPEVGR
jgi:ABC-type transporter Mla MlaB component